MLSVYSSILCPPSREYPMDKSMDSIKRKITINEWYYQYRLETLFIFQIIFIGIAGLLLLSILSSYGIIPRLFVIYYTIIMVGIIGTVWYFKSNYTKNVRDPYHWDKKRFPADSTTSSPINSNMKAAITQGLINTQCS